MKNVLILLLVVSVFNTTIAQNFYFGIKGGLNLATLSGDSSSGLDSRTSFHFGVVGEFVIAENITIQPELLYSAQGAEGDGEKLKLDYLILPLMGKYYVAEGLSLELGPQFGLLLSAKTEFDGADNEDISDSIRDIDFGVNFGVGYKLTNGLNFGLRYNLGIANVNYWLDEFINDLKDNNRVFQISVGYMF